MLGKTAAALVALLPFALADISDGFENGWDQTKWPVYAQDCNQGGTVSLDSTTAHTGKNSMKVTSPGGYCGHIFFGNNNSLPTGSDLYTRVWLKATNALTSNHVSFMTHTDAGLGAGKHLRIGGQNQVLMYNLETTDATLPDMSPQGVASSEPLPAGSWQCFEYHLSKDGTIETWLNSQAISGMTVGPGISNPNANGWGSAYKPDITGVYFGWESYGGDVNTFWYDDISISSTRVGCGTSGGSTPSSSTTTTAKTTTVATSSKPMTSAPTTTPVTTTSKTTLTTKASTTTTTSSAAPTSTAGTVAHYGQCGGQGWTGGTVCQSPYTCVKSNDYYSQCL